MIQDFIVIIPAAITLISLNGLPGAIVNIKEQIPGLPHAGKTAEPGPVPEPVAVPAPSELPPRRFALPPQIATRYRKIIDFFCAPTQDGIIMTCILLFAALATSYVALLVELGLPLMIAASLAALLTIAGSAIVLKTRYERKTWFAIGKPAVPVPVASVPATPVPPKPVTGPEPGSDESSDDELEWYWVAEPFSYVNIKRVGTAGFTYVVTEPATSQKEKTILRETHARLRDVIIYDEVEKEKGATIDPAVVDKIIREFDPLITEDRKQILYYYITRDLSGYGPLEVLMRDPALEDISCNGHGLPVFIFHRAYGSLPTNIFFTESELNQFVLKLAQKANKQLSLSNPLA
ncbi:MAG TPA: type II secretion system protein E, partial [Methanoregula sp.]|nr:type II secretion system protein E [Methanoregula sp.]